MGSGIFVMAHRTVKKAEFEQLSRDGLTLAQIKTELRQYFGIASDLLMKDYRSDYIEFYSRDGLPALPAGRDRNDVRQSLFLFERVTDARTLAYTAPSVSETYKYGNRYNSFYVASLEDVRTKFLAVFYPRDKVEVIIEEARVLQAELAEYERKRIEEENTSNEDNMRSMAREQIFPLLDGLKTTIAKTSSEEQAYSIIKEITGEWAGRKTVVGSCAASLLLTQVDKLLLH